MSSQAIAFPTRRDVERAQPALDLPGPRVWKPRHLADFLGVSVHWVYKRTERGAEDPIPRIPGVGRLSFDTHSPLFQEWIGRQLGYIDRGDADE
ncbi:MAG: hypothetical protein AB1631_10160 [Acidobacteriota bacterium]